MFFLLFFFFSFIHSLKHDLSLPHPSHISEIHRIPKSYRRTRLFHNSLHSSLHFTEKNLQTFFSFNEKNLLKIRRYEHEQQKKRRVQESHEEPQEDFSEGSGEGFEGRREESIEGAEQTPLYIGYGTHISYIYVGNPPQRQSVIIDTGSSFTAFPCTGCSQCGDHTDNYFEPKNSTTAIIPKCGLSTCKLSQSYSEGSSWNAYKVTDEVYVGGLTTEMVPDAVKYTVNLTFGCQTSETGLFRTQLADGIMGMARSPVTIPSLLHDQHVVNTKIFSLCYRIGGGIMTLGGVDQSIHLTDIVYSRLTDVTSGWFGLYIKEVSLKEKSGSKNKIPLNVNEKIINQGGGIIVDSGTTDTYLPAALQAEFYRVFEKITNVKYNNNGVQLSEAQLNLMPDIIFTIIDQETNESFDLVMPVTSYADIDAKGKYVFRVYLTENSGGVLGANFMNNYNIIFDADGNRIGFAQSTCRYDDKTPINPPVIIAPPVLIEENNHTKCLLKPLKYCTARCSRDHPDSNYVSYGNQTFLNECTKEVEVKACSEFCRKDNTIARGIDANCLNTQWSECNNQCKQYRTIVTVSEDHEFLDKLVEGSVPAPTEKASGKKKCNKIMQERDCFVDECPLKPEDFFIFSDLKFVYPPVLPPGHWEKLYEEDLFTALAVVLKIPEGNLDLLVDTTSSTDEESESSKYVKLQLQIAIPRQQFSRVEYFNNKIDSIVTYLTKSGHSIGANVIPILEQISSAKDQDNLHRYVLMKSSDITCQRAVALPMNSDHGDNYLPVPISKNIFDGDRSKETDTGLTTKDYFLIGTALGSVLVLLGMCGMYWKLRSEYAALSKDKVLSSGTSIVQMWNKFKTKPRASASNGVGTGITIDPKQRQEIMSSRNLLNSNREADDEDEEFGL